MRFKVLCTLLGLTTLTDISCKPRSASKAKSVNVRPDDMDYLIFSMTQQNKSLQGFKDVSQGGASNPDDVFVYRIPCGMNRDLAKDSLDNPASQDEITNSKQEAVNTKGCKLFELFKAIKTGDGTFVGNFIQNMKRNPGEYFEIDGTSPQNADEWVNKFSALYSRGIPLNHFTNGVLSFAGKLPYGSGKTTLIQLNTLPANLDKIKVRRNELIEQLNEIEKQQRYKSDILKVKQEAVRDSLQAQVKNIDAVYQARKEVTQYLIDVNVALEGILTKLPVGQEYSERITPTGGVQRSENTSGAMLSEVVSKALNAPFDLIVSNQRAYRAIYDALNIKQAKSGPNQVYTYSGAMQACAEQDQLLVGSNEIRFHYWFQPVAVNVESNEPSWASSANDFSQAEITRFENQNANRAKGLYWVGVYDEDMIGPDGKVKADQFFEWAPSEAPRCSPSGGVTSCSSEVTGADGTTRTYTFQIKNNEESLKEHIMASVGSGPSFVPLFDMDNFTVYRGDILFGISTDPYRKVRFLASNRLDASGTLPMDLQTHPRSNLARKYGMKAGALCFTPLSRQSISQGLQGQGRQQQGQSISVEQVEQAARQVQLLPSQSQGQGQYLAGGTQDGSKTYHFRSAFNGDFGKVVRCGYLADFSTGGSKLVVNLIKSADGSTDSMFSTVREEGRKRLGQNAFKEDPFTERAGTRNCQVAF